MTCYVWNDCWGVKISQCRLSCRATPKEGSILSPCSFEEEAAAAGLSRCGLLLPLLWSQHTPPPRRPSVRPSGRVMSGFWRRRRRPRFSSYWSLCSRSAGRRRAKPRRGYSRTAAERFEEEIDVVALTDDAMWAVREIFPTFGSLGIDFQVWSILCFIAPAPAYILIWMSWAQLWLGTRGGAGEGVTSLETSFRNVSPRDGDQMAKWIVQLCLVAGKRLSR